MNCSVSAIIVNNIMFKNLIKSKGKRRDRDREVIIMEKFIIQLRKQKIANGYWRKILSHLGRKVKRWGENNLEEKVDGAKKKIV